MWSRVPETGSDPPIGSDRDSGCDRTHVCLLAWRPRNLGSKLPMGLGSIWHVVNDQITKISRCLSYQTRIRNKLGFYSKEDT